MSEALIRYDAACRALAEAKAVDEVKAIRDRAEAIRAYARQAKNKALEVDAAEIRIRSERRLGEMLAQQKETVGLNRGGGEPGVGRAGKNAVPNENRISPPTLADAGIDKKLSSRAQKLAAVPEDEFEADVAEWREKVAAEGERVMCLTMGCPLLPAMSRPFEDHRPPHSHGRGRLRDTCAPAETREGAWSRSDRPPSATSSSRACRPRGAIWNNRRTSRKTARIFVGSGCSWPRTRR